MAKSKVLTDDQVRERLRKLDAFVKEGAHFATWDLIVPIADQNMQFTGLHGEFKDWPPMVQDPIMAAIVVQCVPRPGHGVRIVASGCYQEMKHEPCYLRVVVQEFPEKVN